MSYITRSTKRKEVFKTGARRSDAQGRGHYEDFSPMAMRRVAELLERGAVKYGSLNYARGMSMKRTMQSLLRHAYQYLEGDRTEDHLAAVIFNAMVLIHTEEGIARRLIPSIMDDLPNYVGKPRAAARSRNQRSNRKKNSSS